MNSQTIHEAVKLIEELIRDREDLALRLEGVEAHRERLLEDARKRDAAVASLPDVDAEAFWMDGVEVRDDALGVLWANRGHAAEWAASALHALTLFDAEADETSSDDEDMLDSYAVQELTVVASEWQYGVRDVATGAVHFDDAETEEDTRSLVRMDPGFTLIRRGIWEVVPDAR